MRREFFVLSSIAFILLTGSSLAACGGSGSDNENNGGTSKDTTGKETHDTTVIVVPTTDTTRYVGGDISMLPLYQNFGIVYKDSAGNTVDFLPFVKSQGMNVMRVRLFVDPTRDNDKTTVQDESYVISLAKQIKAAGFKLMLDFHYSDTWADPLSQSKPATWSSLTGDALKEQLYNYTRQTLQNFVAAGATPDFIQTGNEISYGMLWPAGKVSYENATGWSYLCSLLNAAGKACREVCPKAKIILHTERTANQVQSKSFYNYMKSNSVDYDIIGLSYYPIWHQRLSVLDGTLTALESSFTDKKIMIVEFGYNYAYYPTDVYDYTTVYPATPAGQRALTSDLITMLRRHNSVTGLVWWFPEENECCPAGWTQLLNSWTNRGLWNNATGCALPALYELKGFTAK